MIYTGISILLNVLFAATPLPNKIDLTSSVSEVTVYSQNAYVVRHTETIAPKESNQIFVIKKLSRFIDKGSINVKLEGSGTISSINFEKTPTELSKDSATVRLLDQRQIMLKDSQAVLNTNLESLIEAKEFLKANKLVRGQSTNLTGAEFSSTYSFYSDEVKKLNDKIYLLQKEKNSIQEKIDDLNSERLSPIAEDTVTYDLHINLLTQNKSPVSFEVSYTIGRAGWYSTYDLRASAVDKPIQLIHKANVSQTNGEDWSDITLSLSNEQPQNSKELPTLEPFYLPPVRKPKKQQRLAGLINSQSPSVSGIVTDVNGEVLIGVNVMVAGTTIGTITDIDGSYTIMLPEGYDVLDFSYTGYTNLSMPISSANMNVTLDDGVELDEVVVTGYGGSRSGRGELRQKQEKPTYNYSISETKIEETTLNYKFTLESEYSISSDGYNNEITIRSIELPCDFKYVVVPKLSESVYLVAYIDEWEEKNLLAGQMNLFFEGAFIGKSILNPVQYADSIKVSLGVDNKIQVERVRDDYYNKQSVFKTKKYTEMSYITTVKNLRNEEVAVEVWDQIPVSTRKGIEVKDIESTDSFIVNESTGIGKWDFTLPKKGSKKVKLKYTIKYPDNYNFDFN